MKIDYRANVTPNQIQDKRYKTSAADTLSSVATMFRVSSSSLARANNLSPDAKLVQGMNLIIPKAKASSGKSGNAQLRDVFTHAPRASVFDQKTATHAPTGQAGKGAARTPLGSTSHIIDALDQIIRRAGPATEQARELKVIKDLANALRDLQGIRDGLSNDLRNPDGIDVTKHRGSDANAIGLPGRLPTRDGQGFEDPDGKYSPDLPSNTDKGPSRLIGSPSSNPRDWMRGISSQDRQTPTTPGPVRVEHRAGGTTVTWQADARTSVQWTQRDRVERNADGTTRVVFGGDETMSVTRTDDSGGKSTVNCRREDGGEWVETTRSYALPREKTDKLLDPSADTPGSGVNPITGLPDGPRRTFIPDQVNPGPEGGTEQPEAPLIQVDRRELVSDPSAVRSGAINPAEIQKRSNTPPDPGPRPTDPND